MPEIVQNQTNNPKPPRRKKNKEIHNAVERHRKEKINSGINRIGDLLPCSQALKQSKNMILGEAFRYITELKRQNDEMLLNGGDKVQAEEIKRLRCQLEDLRKESAHYIELLKANGINFLDDPTIHWKGKQRCAKVAKVTPTHLSKGIIVYSNGNTSCPSNKVSIPPNPVSYLDKQTENAATVQPSCDITLGSGQTLGVTNGAQVSKVVVSSASSHIPVATLIPAVSKPCLTVVEQYSPLAPVTPRINPPVNYITLQGLCPQPAVTTPLPPQLQPDNPTPSLTSATAPAMPLRLQPMLSLSSLPQVVINNSMVPAVPATLLSQNSEIQSLSPLLSANSTLLRTSATSSTQTTWTTLQLAGNTVQPVSQALVTDGASISQNPQQPVLASVGTKHPEESASLQLQPHLPMQLQAPAPTHIPIQPSGARPPQVYSAVVPRPQTAIAQQSSLLSVPAIVSQAVVVHQPPEPQPAQLTHPQLAVRSQPALLPKPQPNSALMPNSNPTIQPKPQLQPVMPSQPHSQPTAVVPQLHLSVVPQAQPIMNPPTQPALVPQPQAATLPVLQTMQVLQVNSDETPVAVTSSPQNNSHVVILQQGSSCPAPQVLREDMTNQTPCQHIVIIQAPTLTPAPQSHHTAIASSATPTLSSQLTTSIPTCTTSMQAAGTKQLVHILPRPSTQLQAQAPQTITVNGQVYVLQPAKSPEKGNSQAGQSVTQILQPTSEEPTSNVAMNCLGALTSLSQSISKVSSQSNLQIYTVTPPSYTTAQSPHPMNGSVVSTCAETVLSASVPLPTTAAGSADKILPKKGSVTSGNRTRQTSVRRSKLVRRKDVRRVAAKSKALVANDSCSEISTVATGEKSLNSVGKDMVNHGNNTQCAPTPISVSSTGSSSGVIGVSSSSEKLADNSVSLSVNGSIVKPSVVSGEISKTKTKSTDVATMPNNVTVSSVSSPVSAAQSSIVVSSSCDSMNKDIFTAHIGPQPNCSVVSVALSSQCSTVDTVATMSVTTPEIHVNSSCSVLFSSESGSQNKVAISSNCSSNKGRSIESSPSITGSSVPLTTVSSTQNNSTVKCVESALCQPTVSSEVSTPNRQLNVGTGSSESGLIVSIMPGQTISQIQDKFARGEELDNSPQIQASFRMPSTSTPGSVTSMSTPAVQLPVTSGVSDSFKSLKQPSEMNISIPTTNHGTCTDFKMAESNMNTQPGKDVHTDGTTAKDVIDVGPFVQKATVPAQQICSIENDSFEPPIGTIRQTDSPLAGGSGGRGFSVASLLPPGHNISASPGTFGAYTFTSEQAEILAMAARAIFEQDSPGKRAAGCSVDNPTSTAATGWDLPKMQSSPSNKESMADQQVKLTKQADLPVSKTSSQVSGRRGPVEPLASGTAGVRLSQSIAYSQSQPSTVTSLNVNNLIRPSSSQPYPGSPNLGQQVSAPSSVGAAIMVSQSSSQVPPPCSGPAQSNEYAPLKNALMRTHVGVGMVDRHQKDMPKRSAQDDLILPNKRSKPCPAGSVARADIKATDHVQMMVSQMPSSTSAVMTRNHSDGVGALFAGNTFMSTVLRPAEGHCSTQVPTHEQTVLHLQQGHSQHSTPQSGQNLGGNPYLKHQQQQDQRHLYQLQHHLTQPESQIHTIHQRTLLQDQHVHKKRGVVRGGQTGPTVALQKQHHLEKSAVQQQHQQQQTPQQHQHQQQQSQQHQQQQQQQHHQQQQQKAQQLQQQQQSHQQQQQQIPPQNSHSRHQHIQQQIQQQHFGARQDKNCEAQQAGQRAHQNNHLGQPERPPGQDHGAMQRLMGSRSMEQQLTSQASNSVSRSSDLACTPSRQERHRLSSYSAEALIGKTSAAGEQRMGVHLQTPRNNTQDQSELRGYVDSSHGKGNIAHSQSRLPPDHANTTDTQRIQECLPFKTLVSGHQLSNFEVQVSRSGDMSSKSVPQIQRGPQSQTGFRMGSGPNGDGRARGTYSGPHPAVQGVHIGAGLPREQEGCHQSFMHSLLAPHITEQNGHQRATQGCTPSSIEYSCVPGTSAGELQAKSSSPNLHPAQKAAPIRLGDNNKGRISQVSGNLHGPPVRAGPPHPPAPHSSSDTGRTQGTTRSLSAVSQRPHHIGPDPQSTKIRPGDRPRSGNLRPGNPFEPESSLPLPSTGGVLLGRTQTGSEARRTSIVRFMPDGAQVSGDNNLVSDQHLTQNFGFPFIAEGGMNPPPPINANASFIPPVSQPSASRTPALLPVEPQNTLPSFYPSYSPAAHPSLPSEIPLQYFSNQMFTSPSTDKSASAPLNNRFGSILSPPRPVGFAQASFPLLTDITPMPIANSSGITPHLSNFNLTSLFPEIATAMPPDGSSMPMSPLLSLANTSSSDSNKQSNRPAHNISHILGHDGTSAV